MTLTTDPAARAVVAPADGPLAVDVSGGKRSFGAVQAVDDFDLSVRTGTVTVLLGPNGAGKTTVMRLLTGALSADAGTIRVLGLDPQCDGTAVRGQCGVVPARPALYDRLNGYDNLQYAAQMFGVAPGATEHRIHEAAGRFGIVDALDRRVGGYSTGMRARLALARAVLHDPELLLLDEPTAGLDPESGRAVLALVDEMAAGGKTVIMCTHLLAEAEGLADDVVVMDGGRVLVAGSPDALRRRYWPLTTVVLDAEDPASLDAVATMPFVRTYQRNGTAIAELDTEDQIADLVGALVARGVRLRRVEPRVPSLEELYFAIRSRSPS